MQKEITEVKPLLDEKGNLLEKGYAKKMLPIYDRTKIKAGKSRIKEWDYYLIYNDHLGVALTIDDNSYMGLDSVSFLDFDNKWEITKSPMQLFTFGKKNFPSTSVSGNVAWEDKGYKISFKVEGDCRILDFKMDKFCNDEGIEGHITLSEQPEESMVICTPFPKDGYFYFNQKINCMPAEGYVKLGNESFTLSPEDTFGILDWGRGVWTYRNTWYWGGASGLVDGKRFGFNIGYGFGDTSAASENMLFYEGKSHKLSQVNFNIPMVKGKEDYMSPWTFTSDDGRFEMDFTPILDRAANTDFVILGSNQHQVFGKFTGEAVLDDGNVIEIKDFMGFAEKVMNKW